VLKRNDTLAAEYPGRRCDARACDGDTQRAELAGLVQRSGHLGIIGNVGSREPGLITDLRGKVSPAD
jgi:hypothetical protein